MVETVANSIMVSGPSVKFDDIQGLEDVKKAMVENIIYP